MLRQLLAALTSQNNSKHANDCGGLRESTSVSWGQLQVNCPCCRRLRPSSPAHDASKSIPPTAPVDWWPLTRDAVDNLTRSPGARKCVIIRTHGQVSGAPQIQSVASGLASLRAAKNDGESDRMKMYDARAHRWAQRTGSQSITVIIRLSALSSLSFQLLQQQTQYACQLLPRWILPPTVEEHFPRDPL